MKMGWILVSSLQIISEIIISFSDDMWVAGYSKDGSYDW